MKNVMVILLLVVYVAVLVGILSLVVESFHTNINNAMNYILVVAPVSMMFYLMIDSIKNN